MAQALASGDLISDDDGSADEDIGSSAGEATRKRSAIPTRPGAEHSLFVRKRAKGSWEPCNFDDDGAQRVPKRLWLCFQRGQWSRPAAAERAAMERDKAADAALEFADTDTMRQLMERYRHGDALDYELATENFFQEYHPQNPYTDYIVWCQTMGNKIALADGEEKERLIKEARERENQVPSASLYLSLIQSVTREAGRVKDYAGTEIPGQGAGYPTVYGYVSACAYFNKCMQCHEKDPSVDHKVLEFLAELRRKHTTRHHAVLDIVEDLPWIREAVFSDPELDHGEKLMWWCLILVWLEHGCRASEMSIFSPLLNQVRAGACCCVRACHEALI